MHKSTTICSTDPHHVAEEEQQRQGLDTLSGVSTLYAFIGSEREVARWQSERVTGNGRTHLPEVTTHW
ncbi:hypothetical protein E2C01_098424 [Portunus trituberculatus]|uniref:Uncharacterized protein n=1 Tax=Portunus trituberculatus TaxID=210409 RepID=A0A5B7KCV5_PORTR|nr:hypothetical protein [Portunus trituberculatus]